VRLLALVRWAFGSVRRMTVMVVAASDKITVQMAMVVFQFTGAGSKEVRLRDHKQFSDAFYHEAGQNIIMFV
jgi:hypothetical protein